MESHTNTMSQHGRQPGGGTHFFFALLPDAAACGDIAQACERFRKSHRLIGVPIDPRDFHLTLCDAGRPERLQQSLEGALLAAAAEVVSDGFGLTLDSATRLSASRNGGYPFVLGADASSTDAAMQLRRAIAEAQRRHGLVVPGVSSYLPHVTMLRGDHLDSIRETLLPIHWQVSEFALVRSFFGQSKHEIVERWPLRSAPAPERFDLSELPDLADLPGMFEHSGMSMPAGASGTPGDAADEPAADP